MIVLLSCSVKGPPLIQKAVRYRLEMLIPYVNTWSEVSSFVHRDDRTIY